MADVDIIIQNPSGLNLVELPSWIEQSEISESFSGPNSFVLFNGAMLLSLEGEGLTYDVENGFPITGTFTSFNVTDQGTELRLHITFNTPLDARDVGDAIRAMQLGDYALYDELFATMTQQIVGGPGNDIIEPLNSAVNETADVANGNSGNDVIFLGGGNDIANGGAGNDTLQSRPDDGDDVLNGGPGTGDTLELMWFPDGPVTIDLRLTGPQDTGGFGIDTLIGIENVIGTTVAETIIGNQFSNRLESGFGPADLLDGQGGNDTLIAQSNGQMTMVGGAGNDKIFGLSGGDSISGDTGDDILEGGFSGDIMSGGAGKDKLVGGGGDGFDDLRGGPDNDIYVVDSANATILEGLNSGIDLVQASVDLTLSAHVENLTLTGGLAIDGTGNVRNNTITGNTAGNILRGELGNDVLRGEAGADQLFGSNGSDRLVGGFGGDAMASGPGFDVFVYKAPAESLTGALRDRLLDFNPGSLTSFVDRIDLSAIDADTTKDGNQGFSFIQSAPFSANTPGQVRQVAASGNTVIWVNVDNDTPPEMQILLIGKLALDKSDFIL